MRPLLPMLLILAALAPLALIATRAQDGQPTGALAPPTQEPTTGSTDPAPPRPTARAQSCLSGGDMREVVSERKVMEPLAAIRAAREALPRAEIVRVNLCHREGEPLFYLITALRRDGQFVHLTVDSQSGAVASLP